MNFCIDRALESGVTSYAELRKLVYNEWKSRWNYSTHFCYSAVRVATLMLKSWRGLKRKGMTKGDRPVARKLFMQLDAELVKYEGDRISIRETEAVSCDTFKLVSVRSLLRWKAESW